MWPASLDVVQVGALQLWTTDCPDSPYDEHLLQCTAEASVCRGKYAYKTQSIISSCGSSKTMSSTSTMALISQLRPPAVVTQHTTSPGNLTKASLSIMGICWAALSTAEHQARGKIPFSLS